MLSIGASHSASQLFHRTAAWLAGHRNIGWQLLPLRFLSDSSSVALMPGWLATEILDGGQYQCFLQFPMMLLAFVWGFTISVADEDSCGTRHGKMGGSSKAQTFARATVAGPSRVVRPATLFIGVVVVEIAR